MRIRILSLILAVIIALIPCNLTVSALETPIDVSDTAIFASVYTSAEDKIAFAAEKDAEYAGLPSTCFFESDEERISYIEQLMAKVAFSDGSEREGYLSELESLGVYLYDPASNSDNGDVSLCATEPGDVTVDTPLIYYNSWESSWTVSCSGKWNNDDWKQDRSTVGNVGGLDGFGVVYTNTSGSYNASVLRAGASMYNGLDGSYHEVNSTTSRSDGDGELGFGFQIQDKVVRNNGVLSYIGKEWFGSCTYTSWFSSYNGNATAYYVHTWDSASLTGVSFGVGADSFNLGFSIINKEYSFKCFGADEPF